MTCVSASTLSCTAASHTTCPGPTSGAGIFMSIPTRIPKPSTSVQDNTIWTPELYQLRGSPKAGKDIWLFDGAKDALHELSTQVLMEKHRLLTLNCTLPLHPSLPPSLPPSLCIPTYPFLPLHRRTPSSCIISKVWWPRTICPGIHKNVHHAVPDTSKP